jgi:hypothetical protein
MFGYVCPVDKMLDEAAQTAFRASYCGVCKSMGMVSRFALSYECAFLALLYDGLTQAPPTVMRACRAFALRRKAMTLGENQRYAADVNTLLAYQKLADDVRDDGGFKARFYRTLLYPSMRKARKRLPAMAAHIENRLSELYKMEKAGNTDIEALRTAFAALLRGIGAPGYDEGGALGRLFFDLGQWIYTVDALLDYEADQKAGRFNALFGYPNLDAAREAVCFALWHSLSQIELSLQTLKPSEPAMTVCKHILYDVLPAHTLRALGQGEGGRDS